MTADDYANSIIGIAFDRQTVIDAFEAGARSRWEPIHKYPKQVVDKFGMHSYGRHILVCGGGCAMPLRARWWETDCGASNFIADGDYAVFPTHWMPLPEPPAPHTELTHEAERLGMYDKP